MADLNKEALDIWEALKPMIDVEIASKTQGMVQRRKAKVTTAPSLVTNTIGVTEPFGTEVFLPFVTNLISANVGDMVWIEWMYGASNSFASMFASADDKDQTVAGNLTVLGTLDMEKRRCNAVLSNAGWYRLLHYAAPDATQAIGVTPYEVEFFINRVTNSTTNELHKVTLYACQNYFRFNEEISQSQTFSIDKIRTMVSGSDVYVDVHYNDSSSNVVYADFNVHCWHEYSDMFSPVSLVSVGDSPIGETEYINHSFIQNGANFTSDLYKNGQLIH